MNWDDLRIIAAVKDEGTFAGASTRLRIDETTVSRRVARIERALGVRLFEAADGLRRPTRQCEAVLGHVQAMARHAAQIAKVGIDMPGPVARFRIASTNVVAEDILSPRAGAFLMQHPGLTLQFLTSPENVNFSGWEADFAIRLRKPEKGDFMISRLADLPFCLIEPAADGAVPVLCGYPDELDLTPESQFLKSRGWQQRLRCVSNNIHVIRNLIRSRSAAGILPRYMCAELRGDHRLKVTPLPKRREVWLLVQNHLRRDAAARTVIAWIRASFEGFAQD